ncbi:MAG: type II pantothenate kinase [Firmicutes bacterium]|nr:type II pantothenate kinase [Bacillota bacterium]
MRITIGIDIGGSTTKIVGVSGNEILAPATIRANDPVASLFGAFGKFVDGNGLNLADISKVMVTGVGSSFITRPIYGLPTAKVAEFLANGLGGLYLSGLERAVIVSMGTGTALVMAGQDKIEHIGGTGIGSGTILGLSSRMLNIRDIKLIIQAAETGDLSKVDLRVGDLTKDAVPSLPRHMTASNFGRISDVATNSDIALGIINLVLQSIGMTAVFASKNTGLDKVVLIGKLTAIPQCPGIFNALTELFGVSFIIPQNSEYATAVGAALAFLRERAYAELGTGV